MNKGEIVRTLEALKDFTNDEGKARVNGIITQVEALKVERDVEVVAPMPAVVADVPIAEDDEKELAEQKTAEKQVKVLAHAGKHR